MITIWWLEDKTLFDYQETVWYLNYSPGQFATILVYYFKANFDHCY